MSKNVYNFKTKANLELLRYCAATFTKCWLAMNANGSWVCSVKKPKLYTIIGMWFNAKAEDYHKCWFTKLPKRPAGFAKHSLIRVNGKGLAWFNERPDVIANSKELS